MTQKLLAGRDGELTKSANRLGYLGHYTPTTLCIRIHKGKFSSQLYDVDNDLVESSVLAWKACNYLKAVASQGPVLKEGKQRTPSLSLSCLPPSRDIFAANFAPSHGNLAAAAADARDAVRNVF